MSRGQDEILVSTRSVSQRTMELADELADLRVQIPSPQGRCSRQAFAWFEPKETRCRFHGGSASELPVQQTSPLRRKQPCDQSRRRLLLARGKQALRPAFRAYQGRRRGWRDA